MIKHYTDRGIDPETIVNWSTETKSLMVAIAYKQLEDEERKLKIMAGIKL